MTNEPMPAKEIIDELNSQWNSSNVTEPNYIVVTGASEQIRYDLNKGDYIIVDQSYSERQLFEKAYERILNEFQIVLKISHEDTQKKLDKALKRNINPQQQTSNITKSPSAELTVEEPISDTEEPIEE